MAKRGINKATVLGNLGSDPDVRYMPGGDMVTSISVATSESWKDKSSGQEREETEWHRINFFGKLAEIAKDHLQKGSQVYVEGKIKTEKWKDKNTGQDRYGVSIKVDSFDGVMQMVGPKPERSNATPPPATPNNSQTNQANANFDDDIPF